MWFNLHTHTNIYIYIKCGIEWILFELHDVMNKNDLFLRQHNLSFHHNVTHLLILGFVRKVINRIISRLKLFIKYNFLLRSLEKI